MDPGMSAPNGPLAVRSASKGTIGRTARSSCRAPFRPRRGWPHSVAILSFQVRRPCLGRLWASRPYRADRVATRAHLCPLRSFHAHAWPHAAMLIVIAGHALAGSGRYAGPIWPASLVIATGTTTRCSSSLPAGKERCGVAWAPGAQATDGPGVAFGRWHTDRLLDS